MKKEGNAKGQPSPLRKQRAILSGHGPLASHGANGQSGQVGSVGRVQIQASTVSQTSMAASGHTW